jgi:hypothetical protein
MYKFKEFLIEKSLESLILESRISFSKDFFRLLSSIKNPLAKKILKLHGKDVDTTYNYIDITDQNDMVSFTPDRRAQDFIKDKEELYEVVMDNKYLTNHQSNQSVFDRLEHERVENVWQPRIGTLGKIISTTYGSSGKIYVLFQGIGENSDKKTVLNFVAIKPINEEFVKIWQTSRNNIKVGRIIKALVKGLDTEVSDSEIEKFVNEYKSLMEIMKDAFKKFDIVEGSDIARFYKLENYADQNKGTLANSCMAERPESTFYIYANNPESCKLLVLYADGGEVKDGKYKSNKIVGRSILWTTRSGDKFLDRIYTNNDSDVDLFKKFAQENNWWTKQRQDSSNDFKVERGGEVKPAKFIVDLQKWDEEFPYLDSLSFFNPVTGELSNQARAINAKWELLSTSGDYNELWIEDED